MSFEINGESPIERHVIHLNSKSKSKKVIPAIYKESVDEILNYHKLKSDKEERICRICFEHGNDESPLISPCRCSGSVRYIHEECLKTWLVSQDGDLAEGKCELCKTKYIMTFEISNKCVPKESLRQGISHFLFIPLLSAVVAMLFVIVYLLADKYLAEADSQERGYMIALIIVCGISGLVIFLLICNSIKESCIVAKLANWIIFTQNDELDQSLNPIKLEVPKDEMMLERSISNGSGILLIPKNVKIGSRKLRTPTLHPPMIPVMRSGVQIAFTPRCLSAMSLISDNSSFLNIGASRSFSALEGEMIHTVEKIEPTVPFLSST